MDNQNEPLVQIEQPAEAVPVEAEAEVDAEAEEVAEPFEQEGEL
jgi:hypothetical protein